MSNNLTNEITNSANEVALIIQYFLTMERLYPPKGNNKVNYFCLFPTNRVYGRIEKLADGVVDESSVIHMIKLPQDQCKTYAQVIQLSKEVIESGKYDLEV